MILLIINQIKITNSIEIKRIVYQIFVLKLNYSIFFDCSDHYICRRLLIGNVLVTIGIRIYSVHDCKRVTDTFSSYLHK